MTKWRNCTIYWGFVHAFSSVVRQMPGYNSQRRGTARTLPNYKLCCFIYYLCVIVLLHVLFLFKCVLYYCQRLSTQLQLTNILILIIEDVLEEDGKGETNTIIMGDWNSTVADKTCWNIVGQQGLGRRSQNGQCLSNFQTGINLLSSTYTRSLTIWPRKWTFK